MMPEQNPAKGDDKSFLNYGHDHAQVITTVATESNRQLLTDRMVKFFRESALGHVSPRALSFARSPKTSPRSQMPKEETYNPLKLPHYDTYVPLDKEAYLKTLTSIKPKIASFRRVSQGDMARQQKFIDEEDDKFKDNPLFDSKAANSSAMRSNNLYKIKLKVDAQMKINQDAQKRE